MLVIYSSNIYDLFVTLSPRIKVNKKFSSLWKLTLDDRGPSEAEELRLQFCSGSAEGCPEQLGVVCVKIVGF